MTASVAVSMAIETIGTLGEPDTGVGGGRKDTRTIGHKEQPGPHLGVGGVPPPRW
jgi:hypothetical protein